MLTRSSEVASPTVCGRYVAASPPDEVAAYFGAEQALPELAPNYNVAPTTDVAAVVQPPRDDAAPRLEAFHWGLVPRWATDIKIGNRMINARGETIATKNAFRSAFARRRCIIAADGFYEWRKSATDPKRKQPYYIHRADGEPLAMAGLWERWRDPSADDDSAELHSCTIVTTAANAFMSTIHDRMPVLLPPTAFAEWLDPDQRDTEALQRLVVPAPEGLLVAHAVDTAVGNVRNRGAELRSPIVPDDTEFAAELT